LKDRLPLYFSLVFGGLTLVGLLLLPILSSTLLGWAGFLAALALVLGVLNLLAIHLRRAPRSGYSAALVLSMLVVFALALSDYFGATSGAVEVIMTQVQQPLEAALGALLVFFLLFAALRALRTQRNLWGVFFLVSLLLFLLAAAPLPEFVAPYFVSLRDLTQRLFVTSGVRGILLGVALGTVVLGLRLLLGLEHPSSNK
jgi:uncharacterized membrane protein YhaH (DUF805 family)